MKKLTTKKLKEILELHKKWLEGLDGICANLRYSDLRYSDLRGANLRDSIGEMKYIKSMQIEEYYIVYTYDKINIGCKSYSIEEWKNFTDNEISKMDIDALDWWKKWKPILMNIIEMSPCIAYKD